MNKDKMLGVIYGQAIGDALGLGTEFLNKNEIKRLYPKGISSYEQIIQDYHRMRWKKGDWTDDTDQMLCIANAIINDKSIKPLTVAKELYNWRYGRPMGIGEHTLKVLSYPGYKENPEIASKIIWEQSGKQSAANGAVMRTSILGLFSNNIEMNAEKICKLTHYDPRCVGSCVIVTKLINKLINNLEISSDDIFEIAGNYDNRIIEYILFAKEKQIDYLNLDDDNSMGYTLKTLGAGLWTYFNSTSFEDGLLKVVNEGGDADTNGAVAGSILGGKYGYSNIPEKYILGLVRGEYLGKIAETIISLIFEMQI